MTLDELQAVCDAATPGPWSVRPRNVAYYRDGQGEPDLTVVVENDALGAHIIGPDKPLRGDFTTADAFFITAAREYMPKLIARLKEALEMSDNYYADANEMGLMNSFLEEPL